MPNTPSQVAGPELIAAWLSRTRNLRSLIEADPSGRWTWLWRVRLNILDYLLRRYGGDVTARDLRSSSMGEPSAQAPPVESTAPYVRKTVWRWSGERPPHAPRARADFQDRLDRVHEANEEPRLAREARFAEEAFLERKARAAREARYARKAKRAEEARLKREARLAELDPRRRIVCLTYPEDGFQLPNERLRDQQHAIMQSELAAIREFVSRSPDLSVGGPSLTDAEILAILCADAG